MKVSELKQQVAQAGGSLKVGDLYINHNPDSDIDVCVDSNVIAWVRSSSTDDDVVEEVLAFMTDRVLSHVDSLGQLAQFFGIKVKDVKPIELQRTVVQQMPIEDMEKHKLAGKVEAYENILIGRSITAS